MKKLFLFLAWICWCLTGVAFAQDLKSGQGPTPDWVENVDLLDFPDDRANAVQGGIAYILTDSQVKWEPGGYHYYRRLAMEVTDRSGLEAAAKIAPSFDPEQTTLNFNFIRVIRDGVVMDRLPTVEIIELRQEEGLSEGLIDGDITAMIQLEDIQVGDIVDYAWSGFQTTKLWPDDMFQSVSVEWSVPLAMHNYVLTLPRSKTLQIRNISTDIMPEKTQKGDETQYRITLINPEPVPNEGNIPADVVEFGFIHMSTMDSWTDVSEWGIPYYLGEKELPREFKAKVDKIARDFATPEDRLVEALRLVQEEIRYFGIVTDLGSHVPRDPVTTIERGYGDCKDKTLLLTTVLNYLGVEAVPAFANTTGGYYLDQVAPAVGAFNHVIVEAVIDGEPIWLDPTMSHQGGRFENLVIPDYGYVLPVRKGQAGLVKIKTRDLESPFVQTHEVFTLLEDGDDGFTLEVTTTHSGAKADETRRRIASRGIQQLEKNYLDFYTKLYPGIEAVGDIEAKDDFEANQLQTRESYRMPREVFKQDGFDKKIYLSPSTLLEILPTSLNANRQNPLGLAYPFNVTHTIELYTPGRSLTPPDDKEKAAMGIEYSQSFKTNSDRFFVEYAMQTTEWHIPLSDAADTVRLAKEISDDGGLTFNPSAARPTLSKRLGLTDPLDSETEQAFNVVLKLMKAEDYVDALAELNVLTAEFKDPGTLRGFVEVLRGEVLAELDRDSAALEAFDEGFEYFTPDYNGAYFQYASLLMSADRYTDTAKLITRLAKAEPDEAADLNHDWVMRLSRTLTRLEEEKLADDLMISLAAAQYQFEDKDNVETTYYSKAIKALAERGDTKTAGLYLGEVSNPDLIADILMNVEMKGLWSEAEKIAGPNLSKVLEKHVKDTRKKSNSNKRDLVAMREHLSALRQVGRSQDAVAYGKKAAANWARIEAVGEDGFWFINEYAYALADIDRIDEAEELLKRLMALGLDKYPDLVSMGINRASLLLSAGRYEDALKLALIYEFNSDFRASDYGEMWLYATKTCAMYELGKKSDAETVLKVQMTPISDENPAAHTQALLCLGMDDEVEDLYISRLKNDKHRETALRAFADYTIRSEGMPHMTKLLDQAKTIKDRPKVKAAFKKVARPLIVAGGQAYWGDF